MYSGYYHSGWASLEGYLHQAVQSGRAHEAVTEADVRGRYAQARGEGQVRANAQARADAQIRGRPIVGQHATLGYEVGPVNHPLSEVDVRRAHGGRTSEADVRGQQE